MLPSILLSTNHVTGARALAGAVKDKSSFSFLEVSQNDIGDTGRPG